MNTFVEELRKAHTIEMAYKRGVRGLNKLPRAVQLPRHEVVFWLEALRLPVTYGDPVDYQFPFRQDPQTSALGEIG